jgi:hypothetical protein
MRISVWLLSVVLLAGCQSETPPASESDLVEPATFSKWPSVTDEPVRVSSNLWALCSRMPTPEEARAIGAATKRHGPHASHSIVVRVSPEALAPFREGKPLPTGAVVVKEKYANPLASGPLYDYAMMIKQEAGYYPEGGDWEYVYVTLGHERKVSRGRLTQCAGCHVSAKERDYLFRSYGSGQ